MPRLAQYWASRRVKAGKNFGKNVVKTAMSPTIANMARTAWSGLKGIRALINAEKHFTDFSSTAVLPAAGGVLVAYHQIAQGDGNGQRTGNSILVNNVQFRCYVAKDPSATNSLCRVMLVHDKQQIADTLPGVTDILASANPLAPLNRSNLGRFTVLQSKTFSLTSSMSSRKFSLFKKFKQHHIRYNGTTVNDVQKGGLYVIMVSNEATYRPTYDFQATTAYYDN